MQWWLKTRQGHEKGPYEEQELLDAVRQGDVQRSALVRAEDDTTWYTIAEHPVLGKQASSTLLSVRQVADAPNVSQDFADVRFSTPLLVALTACTLGLYEPLWYAQKRAFFASISTTNRVGSVSSSLIGVSIALQMAVAGYFLGGKAFARALGIGVARQLQVAVSLTWLVAAVVGIVLAFRGRQILEEYFERVRKPCRFSHLWTLLFRTYYLQYRINQVVDDYQIPRS